MRILSSTMHVHNACVRLLLPYMDLHGAHMQCRIDENEHMWIIDGWCVCVQRWRFKLKHILMSRHTCTPSVYCMCSVDRSVLLPFYLYVFFCCHWYCSHSRSWWRWQWWWYSDAVENSIHIQLWMQYISMWLQSIFITHTHTRNPSREWECGRPKMPQRCLSSFFSCLFWKNMRCFCLCCCRHHHCYCCLRICISLLLFCLCFSII